MLLFAETDAIRNDPEDEGEDKGDGIKNSAICERVERLMRVARPGRRANVSRTQNDNNRVLLCLFLERVRKMILVRGAPMEKAHPTLSSRC